MHMKFHGCFEAVSHVGILIGPVPGLFPGETGLPERTTLMVKRKGLPGTGLLGLFLLDMPKKIACDAVLCVLCVLW
jgi:hypothetical protein